MGFCGRSLAGFVLVYANRSSRPKIDQVRDKELRRPLPAKRGAAGDFWYGFVTNTLPTAKPNFVHLRHKVAGIPKVPEKSASRRPVPASRLEAPLLALPLHRFYSARQMILFPNAIQVLVLVAVVIESVPPFAEPVDIDSNTRYGVGTTNAPPILESQRQSRRSGFDTAPIQEPADPVDRLYQRAHRFRMEARYLGAEAAAATSYLRACELLAQEVTRLDPGRTGAYSLWGVSLLLQAEFTADPALRGRLITAGNEKFALGEKQGEVNAGFYALWAKGMTRVAMMPATDPSQQLAFVEEAAAIITRGLTRYDSDEDRQQLLPVGAMVAVALGEKLADPAARLQSYRLSIERYLAFERLGTELSSHDESLCMAALYRAGDLDDDKQLAEQAVERGRNWLRREPLDPLAQFKLACAYSVSGKYQDAMRHLKISVETDRDRFLPWAATEPALRGLRSSPEYKAFSEMYPPVASPSPSPD